MFVRVGVVEALGTCCTVHSRPLWGDRGKCEGKWQQWRASYCKKCPIWKWWLVPSYWGLLEYSCFARWLGCPPSREHGLSLCSGRLFERRRLICRPCDELLPRQKNITSVELLYRDQSNVSPLYRRKKTKWSSWILEYGKTLDQQCPNWWTLHQHCSNWRLVRSKVIKHKEKLNLHFKPA